MRRRTTQREGPTIQTATGMGLSARDTKPGGSIGASGLTGDGSSSSGCGLRGASRVELRVKSGRAPNRRSPPQSLLAVVVEEHIFILLGAYNPSSGGCNYARFRIC